jgi:hypothetical protein
MHTAITQLRHVLHKWLKGGYSAPDQQMLAYLLHHQYSEINLKSTALKGEDAHLIAHLRDVAEEMGIALCLAKLKYLKSGYADDYGYGYHKRGRYYDESSDDGGETPDMVEVLQTDLTISNLVDLNGMAVLQGPNIKLSEGCLIPEDAFEDEEPDDKDYEGYTGNVGILD